MARTIGLVASSVLWSLSFSKLILKHPSGGTCGHAPWEHPILTPVASTRQRYAYLCHTPSARNTVRMLAVKNSVKRRLSPDGCAKQKIPLTNEIVPPFRLETNESPATQRLAQMSAGARAINSSPVAAHRTARHQRRENASIRLQPHNINRILSERPPRHKPLSKSAAPLRCGSRSASCLKHGRAPFALDGEDRRHWSNVGLRRWRRD